MPDVEQLSQNFENVQRRIMQACEKANRPVESVQLLAVSKTKPIDAVNAIAKLGQTDFGENYLQESLQKITERPDLTWHFIGPIQSNKTKSIAENFAWVHSIDRLKIAERLSRQRPKELPPLHVLLEVNIDNEASKSGFHPDEAQDICEKVLALPNLELRGLMAIPQATDNVEKQHHAFAQMHQLLEHLQKKFPNAQLDTLSMGMSGDLEAAIAEGATIVRIGTDIFGARNYS
ncbi:YggS family pyridoxal phosphate-dependent enzyme [Thiomicrorhabdus indica]|uniref:YggS family pyridoxal phosphate-dependent enzyme n=1 Tax=Thiomicrorhabdus indica TaxID=2267253 RepID=UPI00102D964A|nr:YggS family pyridoxal phosphate-dependent enzyme [Thiomicrorhabdus indica]